MEEAESFCPDHDLQFSKYCTSCERPFCAKCPPHNDSHMVLPLLCVITPEAFLLNLKDIHKILDNIDAALYIIPQVVDDLLDSMRPNKETPLDDAKKDYTSLKEFESKVNEQIKDLAVVTGAYDALKMRVERLLKRGESVKPAVEANYYNELLEAYKVIMELKGFPKEVEEARKELERLEKRMEEVSSIYVQEKIWQRQTFKHLTDYVENLKRTIELVGKETLVKMEEYHIKNARIKKEMNMYKEASEKPVKMSEGKRLKTNRRIREIEEEMNKLSKEKEDLLAFIAAPEEEDKELKVKTKELDEARDSLAILKNIYDKSYTEINTIPAKLMEAKEELNNIMRKRRSELDEATKCINQVKSNKAWMQKTIAAKKQEIISEIEQHLHFKKLDVIEKVSTTEKKLLLRNVKSRLEQLARDRQHFTQSLRSRQSEINKIKNYYSDIKRDKLSFQISIDRLQLEDIVMTLNDIEKSKKDVEESSRINRLELVAIMNDLITVENEIERKIEQKEVDLKKSAAMPKELENEVYELMDKCEAVLKPLEEFLERDINNRKATSHPLCADGKPGKVELKCGHYLCYQCFFKKRDKAKSEDDVLIPCLACGGLKQEAGKVV
eukprot:TRINITY_DN2765_c0_g1_i13.p1 TRINITY_DN2765_c0_g1~~TRINITY_DN2765_c0_g1_i13.p1  ORF type:complete len:621 (+),score=214.36 TRINITY_DN2765_c0_g1_i13:31-1863(+)